MSHDSEAVRRQLDAERVTWAAQAFLNRMGYKRSWLRPKKATLEGEKYLVELQVQNKTATVQVDLATGEIKGFTIEESEQSSGLALNRKTMLIIGAGAAIVVVIVALKFAGMF